MTPQGTRVLRRESAAQIDSTLARRVLPEDPVLRSALIAARLREITGPQHQAVTCWQCDQGHCETRYGEGGWTAGPDGTPVCHDQDACNDRAAEAGLVPVIGGPGEGGDVA